MLKDFVQVAGPLGITHFLLLSATQNASYLRVAKVPRGPTLTMRIHQYALQRDVLTSQQRPRAPKVRRGFMRVGVVVVAWGAEFLSSKPIYPAGHLSGLR